MTERCEIPRCRAETAIGYLGHGVCERHWNQLAAEDAPPDALRKALGIVGEPTVAMEETTMTESTQKKTDGNPEKPSKGKAGKSKQVKSKSVKEPKLKKERTPRPELCVFAFRLTKSERETLHRAAGPAKASQFVLGAALAAANADTKAFTTLAEQARSNLK